MSVGAISSGTGAQSYLSSPAVQFAQLQGSAMSTLFAGATGEPSDLAAFTATAVAMPLFQQPGLLTGLTSWDGSMLTGSERAAAAAAAPAPTTSSTPTSTTPSTPPPMFSFNPFDQASWWTDPKGSAVDTTV